MEDESHGILHYVRDAPALVVISVHSPVDSLMAWWSSSCFTGNCFSLRLVPQDVWCCCFCWASVFSLFFWRRTHRKTDTKSPYNNLIQWQQRLKEKGGGSQVMRIFLTEWVWSMTAEVQQTQYKSLPVTDCCFSRVFFFTDRDWERLREKQQENWKDHWHFMSLQLHDEQHKNNDHQAKGSEWWSPVSLQVQGKQWHKLRDRN